MRHSRQHDGPGERDAREFEFAHRRHINLPVIAVVTRWIRPRRLAGATRPIGLDPIAGVPIGEIGLDFKFNRDKKQTDIFKSMLKLAEEIDRPVIVHSRGAEKEVLDVLKKFDLNVVMHCFSGDLNLINKQYYYSIPVSVVERKWVQELAKKVDANNILTESDSPYVIFKKRKSRPEDVKEALKKISEIKEISLDKIKDTIFTNYTSVFHE